MKTLTTRVLLPIAAAMLLALGGAAVAQEKRTPLDEYRAQTVFGVMLCALTFKQALAQARLVEAGGATPEKPADYVSCINRERDEVKPKFAAALKSVKKAPAREALKSVHVAFMVALDGVRPGMDERVIDYERRQQALRDKLDEAWTRFDVEN